MKPDESKTLVGMIRAAVAGTPDPATITFFEKQMLSLDAELATRAVHRGRESWKFFPSWAEFRECYRTERKLSEPDEWKPAQGKYGVEAPEWVWVWHWARNDRDPREHRAMPQQLDPALAPTLTATEYEALRAEWIAAGSPRAANPIPMAR